MMDILKERKRKILIDTVRNPMKGLFLGGPDQSEAIRTLKREFGYSNREIRKLQK